MNYETVVGLEIHIRLATATKLFCGCANRSGGVPNSRVCSVCLGLPGTLPVLNARAVSLGLRLAAALGADIPEVSIFARKQYVYPDLPRNYQITQWDPPLAVGGALVGGVGGDPWRVPLRRIHLEEDAARLTHRAGADTRIDFDRAGAPLLEVVTEPVLRSGAEAERSVRALQRLVRWLEVSAARPEAGDLRCDANVSVRVRGSAALGSRVELKNMNSSRGVRLAVAYEAMRQEALLAAGGEVLTETRTWDPDRCETVLLRAKEDVPEYRYLPEPDLPPLRITAAEARPALPEAPWTRERRFVSELGLTQEHAAVLTASRAMADLYESVLAEGASARNAAQLLTGEATALARERKTPMVSLPWQAPRLARLVDLIASGVVPAARTRELLVAILDREADPVEEVERRGWTVVIDQDLLGPWIETVLDRSEVQVAAYRGGKRGLLGWFVAQVVTLSGGRADPGSVARLVAARLSERA